MTTDDKRKKLIEHCGDFEHCNECPLYGRRCSCGFSGHMADYEVEQAYAVVFNDDDDIDYVNHPPHYQGAHECIEVMQAMFGVEAVKAFCRCNAFKYRFRADWKDGVEDIKKAEWYEDYLIKLCDSEERNTHEDN